MCSLLPALILFHALISERRTYGRQGWNFDYNFTSEDLSVSLKHTKIVLDEYGHHNFKFLHYMIGECNYGGRITDNEDLKYLLCALADFVNADSFTDSGPLAKSLPFRTAGGDLSREDCIALINSIPNVQSPDFFGLNTNANNIKDLQDSGDLFQKLSLAESSRSKLGDLTDVENKDTTFLEGQILSCLPSELDQELVETLFPTEGDDSLNVILTREISRLNALVRAIRESVLQVVKALRELQQLLPDEESLWKDLRRGAVPACWRRWSYASKKPVASYLSDLGLRVGFFRAWVDGGKPAVFWMAAFFNPSAFLSAVLHNFARRRSISSCVLSFRHDILADDPPRGPEDGVFVRGLLCVAGCWNVKAAHLDEAPPRAVTSNFPTVWFCPNARAQQSSEWSAEEAGGTPTEAGSCRFQCPLYEEATAGRRLVCHVAVPSILPQSHWIKRGTALLLQAND